MKSTMLALSAVALLGTLACGNATAMGRAQTTEIPAVVVEPPTSIDRLSAGTYQQGLQLGRRNGDILVGRLRQATIGRQGCAGVDDLQDALIKVTRGIRPPAGSNDEALVAGFYRGYLDSVRKAVRDARVGCNRRSFLDGAYAGQLYGALLCQVSSVSIEAVESLQIQSLYEGWSGGSSEVIGQCRSAATVTIKDCAGDLNDSLLIQLEQSCSDALDL